MTGPHRRRQDPETTRRVMRANRGKDTRPELLLRRELHRRGIRYRLHARDVPGRPDLVIRRLRVAVFVDGDFWHGNRWRLRGLARLEDDIASNHEYWVPKITAQHRAGSPGHRPARGRRMDSGPGLGE